ncbi:LmeA family phospholipid-binding protein [Kitasatospora sp. McL0602]|uniref:LmeA family phospholipid-binding protein n=1 Tax=Kitasatospora sp. McL0602 TaxID=3439530 RepID=UPI003F8B9341
MRGLVKLTIGLVVLGGLLFGADRVAVGVAEDQAADKLVSSGRLSSRPHVSIGGFPFLTQAVTGRLDDVRLSGEGVTATDGRERIALRSFSARLSGVEFDSGYSSATVRTGSGSGLVPYPDVARLLAGGGRPVELAYAGPGKVKATLAGLPLGQGNVHSAGNTITADGFQLQGVASLLGGAGGEALEARSVTLSYLPAGLGLASATPQPDGLLLTFQGSNIKLLG